MTARPKYRSPMEFQAEAKRVLNYAHNLHAVINTVTFIWHWGLFAILLWISHWIPAHFVWFFRVGIVIHLIIRIWKYFPAMWEHVPNLPHMRRLADEARLNFARDGLVPERMSWTEIVLGIGRLSKRPPRHAQDQGADWCMTHEELLMQYINRLPREVEELRRERRSERRNLLRQQAQRISRKIETAPVLSSMMAAARSTLPHRPHQERAVRPTTPKPRREPRPVRKQLLTAPPPDQVSTTNGASPMLGAHIRRLEQMVELLQLADVIPSEVDHDHVRAIIVWGCLRPGRRGQTKVKAAYRTVQWTREDIRNKLGKRFDPEAYDQAMDFLVSTRVIMTDHKRKRHQPVIAINPHARTGIGVGPEIIKRTLATKDRITELTRG